MSHPGRLHPARAARPRLRSAAAALVAALAGAALLPAPARAWDDVGHMAIALVAWRHMTPEARARAAALLRAAPPGAGLAQLRPNEGGPEARDQALFARAATWADLVRDRRDSVRYATYHHGPWHYLSWYWRPDSAAGAASSGAASARAVTVSGLPADSQSVVERIAALRPVVADPAARPETRAVALAWVLHLVGDVHNPVHTASRVTPAHPAGDAGGNAVRLTDDGRPTNLHAVWDDLFDAPGQRAGGEGRGRPGPDALLAIAGRAADEMERALPAADAARVEAQPDPGAWAREGQTLDQTAVYTPDLVEGAPIPATYIARAKAVALPRAAAAGYRLAALLNRALDPTR